MGQSVMNENRTWQRKNLCLVLQAAERAGEYHPVEISLEIASRMALVEVEVLQPQPFIGNQLSPNHNAKI